MGGRASSEPRVIEPVTDFTVSQVQTKQVLPWRKLCHVSPSEALVFTTLNANEAQETVCDVPSEAEPLGSERKQLQAKLTEHLLVTDPTSSPEGEWVQ